MNKENLLFGIVGLLAGTIIGFMFANSLNRNMAAQPTSPMASTMSSNSNMPPGHPDIAGMQQPGGPNATELMPQIEAAVELAKKNPTDFEAQFKAAELYNQIERYDEAAEYLKNANKLKPDDYETIVNLGNVSFDGGKLDEAEKWYSAALGKKKDDESVRNDLGLVFLNRIPPNFDRAIQEFNTILAANPKHIKARQNAVVTYLRKGDSAKAKEYLASLESVDPTNAALPVLKKDLEKSLQSAPKN